MRIEDTDKTVWFVWCPTHSVPSVQHTSLASAEREAKRLAALHAGRQFLVLELVGVAEKIDVAYRRTKHIEIPF